jgi:hypothetical protein
VENWFVGGQRELRHSMTVEVNYVGTAGRKLFRAESVNRVPGARLPEGTCVTDIFGRRLRSQVDSNLASNGIKINPTGRLNPNYGRLRVWEAHWTPFRGGDDVSKLEPLVPGACDPLTFDPSNCVNIRSDYNLDGDANDRPNAIANNVDATHAQWANGFNLPELFFSTPCLGCVGNLGRNTFLGPGYWEVDTSIFKTFRISDRFQLQFRAEAFNLFNHTNFQLGGTTGPADGNNLNNPQFGQAGGTSNPRNLQFGLKMNF